MIPALAFVALYFAQTVNGEGRIYGGYPINITQAPYMAHVLQILSIDDDGLANVYNCGGTILRKNLILTAGHCTKNSTTGVQNSPSSYRIRVGSDYPLSGGTMMSVKKVFTHPKFEGSSNNFHHDVGILQLTRDVTISSKVQYTKLVHKNDDIPDGRDGVVSGWGENPDHPNDQRLYQVHLNVISAKSCKQQFGSDQSEESLEQHEICAQASGKNFCKGDSGGPFVDTTTNRQIGIVSYGAQPCTLDKPSVFARVQDNLDFIQQTIKQTRPANSN